MRLATDAGLEVVVPRREGDASVRRALDVGSISRWADLETRHGLLVGACLAFELGRTLLHALGEVFAARDLVRT